MSLEKEGSQIKRKLAESESGDVFSNRDKRSEARTEAKNVKLRKEDVDIISKPICLAPESSPTLGPSCPSHSQQ